MNGWRLWAAYGLGGLGLVFWFRQSVRYGLLLVLLHLVGEELPQWDGTAEIRYWLDVRELEEYEVSHLPNARWVGSSDFTLERLEGIPKDAPVLVYCSVGIRSQRVGQVLLDAGYTQVVNLKGGIFKWLADGHEVVNLQEKVTDNIHPYDSLWGGFAPRGNWVRQAE